MGSELVTVDYDEHKRIKVIINNTYDIVGKTNDIIFTVDIDKKKWVNADIQKLPDYILKVIQKM